MATDGYFFATGIPPRAPELALEAGSGPLSPAEASAAYTAMHHQLVASARAVALGRELDADARFGCMIAADAVYPRTCAPADVLAAHDRTVAGPTAPPQGLVFVGPLYPESWMLPEEVST